MSRRKQANPKPLQKGEEGPEPVAKQPSQYSIDSSQSCDDEDEFRPLVIDTSQEENPREATGFNNLSSQEESPREAADLTNHTSQEASPTGATSIKNLSAQAGSAQQATGYKNITSQEGSPKEATCFKNPENTAVTIPEMNMPIGEAQTPSPSEASVMDFDFDSTDALESRRSSISSGDSHCYSNSLLNLTAMSPKEGLLQHYAASHLKRGKGTAPSKTRRKGDRILPVGTDTGMEKFVCPVCKQLLATASDFTRHIRSHNTTTATNINTCTICGKVLSSQSSLDRHMLVHSGERPFECRVCKMSFTTNGNMHRHMRIHEKEQMSNISNSTFMTPQKDLPAVGSAKPRSRNKRFLENPVVEIPRLEEVTPPRREDRKMLLALKRKLETPTNEKEEVPQKKPTPPLVPLTFPPEQRPSDQSDVLRPYKRLLHHGIGAEDKNAKANSTEIATFQCTVCNERFHSSYGLETHMAEAHSDLQNVCPLCFMVFHSARGLQVHQVMVHQSQTIKKEESSQEPASPNSPAPVGFKDLSCIDFSSKKFPEISRAWCEKNQRMPSSYLHDFTCRQCGHAFPSRGALRLHMDSHTPERTSTCHICDCRFRSQEKYRAHMAQHNSEKVVHSYTKMSGAEDNDLQDCVSKPEFMLVMGLALKGKQSPPKNLSTTFSQDVRQDMKLNVEYYYKVTDPELKKKVTGERRHREHVVPMKSQALLEQLKAPPLTELQDNRDQKPLLTTRTQAESNPRSFTRRGQHSMSPCQTHSDDDTSVMEEDLSRHSLEAVGSDTVYREDQDDPYVCKYCDESFVSYRAMKTHERSHLGLSPYQCNLCSYSSTDKSTLVRHLRTHNGERPFQCLVCDFAFTTKANCERHVRKRHEKTTKEEVESAIGYNQYISENSLDAEAFTSPDTVCRYCGEDFKFFRALKHHLRSHSSCRHKPFMCKLCNTGFSTKANCMRHVQKQHPEVEQNQVEAHIQVNEITDELEEEQSPPSLRMSSTPRQTTDWTRPDLTLEASPVQPGWKQQPIKPLPMRSAGFSLCKSPAPFINTPPTVKPEHLDSGFEQPLDFSMKSQRKSLDGAGALDMSRTGSASPGNPFVDQDMPMDLTVKKPAPESINKKPTPSISTEFIAAAPSHRGITAKTSLSLINLSQPMPYTPYQSSSRPSYGNPYTPMKLPVVVQSTSAMNSTPAEYKSYQKHYNPLLGVLQCSDCGMIFKNKSKFVIHLRSHLSGKADLEKHIKRRHNELSRNNASSFVTGVDTASISPAYLKFARHITAHQAAAKTAAGSTQNETNNNIPKGFEDVTVPRNESKSSTSSSYSSDTELASVTRILDATDPLRFQRFFRERVTSPQANHTQNPAKPLALDAVSALTTTESLGFKPNIKREIDDQRSESPESQVSASVSQLTSASCLTDCPSPVKDEELDDCDMAHSPGGDPNKKKRNSYADSPHKLQCPYCPRAFPWISSLKRHLLTHTGQKPFKCPQCPVTFSTKSNRERHMIRKHGLNVHDPATRQMMDRPYKCHLCVFSSFSTAGNLLKHYKERHPEKEMSGSMAAQSCEDSAFYGDLGPDNLSTTSDFSSSVMNLMDFDEEDEEEEECTQDGLGKKVLCQPRDFSLSPGPSVTPSSPSDTPYITPVPTPVHFISTPDGTPDRHINPERDNYNVDKITECWKCGMSFESRKSLLRHLKEHNIDCPYKCYLCDASFDTRSDSLEHKISRHAHDWEMIKDKNKIVDHQEFVAAQDSLVQETLAGRLTSRTDVELGEDIKPESDYAQRKVYCSLCIKRFWSLQDLRRHMRSHTGERPFECDVCQARFTLKHSMMRHRRKHLEAEGNASDDEGSTALLGDSHDPVSTASPVMSSALYPSPASRLPAHTAVLSTTPGELPPRLVSSIQGDLLHNLLGVEDADIDHMLNSAADAAKMLGMQRSSKK